jgi:hypothetical protein
MQEYNLTPTRRSYTRFKLDTGGKILLPDKEITAICRDISGRGVGVVCRERLAKSTDIEVKIFIPWIKKWIIRKGKIVWLREIYRNYYHYGINFGLENLPFSAFKQNLH